jgi:hypothetical protein
MEHNGTTIEELARMINEGFNNTATKEDVKGLEQRMNRRFEQIDSRLDNLDARVGRIEADIHELRGEIVYRHEFEDALVRIKYLEKKLGIESGV